MQGKRSTPMSEIGRVDLNDLQIQQSRNLIQKYDACIKPLSSTLLMLGLKCIGVGCDLLKFNNVLLQDSTSAV